MAASVTNGDWVPANDFGNSLGERVLPLAAMGGAVAGAIGGAALAGDAGFLAVVCGTLGTIFGSVGAGGAGFLASRLWSRPAGAESGRAEAREEVVAAR